MSLPPQKFVRLPCWDQWWQVIDPLTYLGEFLEYVFSITLSLTRTRYFCSKNIIVSHPVVRNDGVGFLLAYAITAPSAPSSKLWICDGNEDSRSYFASTAFPCKNKMCNVSIYKTTLSTASWLVVNRYFCRSAHLLYDSRIFIYISQNALSLDRLGVSNRFIFSFVAHVPKRNLRRV
jgi:hypothetical protein